MLSLRKSLPLVALLLVADASLFGVPAQVPLLDPATSSAHNTKAALTPEISALAERLLTERGVRGLSTGFVRRDGNRITTEFGAWGNMSEDGDSVRPETLFSIGSCSKAFLVSAIGILIDDFATGRNVTVLPPSVSTLTWDTKVKLLLPEDWKLDQEWVTEKANLRDIFTHVSGLTRHDTAYHRDDRPIDIIRRIRHLRTKYELREHWSYNNIMYIIGAHLVSTYSGLAFRDFVQQRIFDPLNMTSTTYRGDEAEASGLLSHSWDAQGRRIPYWFRGEPLSELIAGAGGIISNTIDMTKWLATLLNQGLDPTTNHTVIPRSVYEEMTTAHSIVKGQAQSSVLSIAGYGMGWKRVSYSGHDMVSHDGGLPGFLTDVTFLPSDGIGIVTFANTDGSHNAETLLPIRTIDDYLELKHSFELPDGNESQFALTPRFSSSHHQTPVHASDVVDGIPVEHYTGEYHDLGYGTIFLCAPGSKSPPCAMILSDWISVSPNGQLDHDTLYGTLPNIWRTHIKLRRTRTASGSETYSADTVAIFPHGYGRDSTPFEYGSMEGSFTAECEVDKHSARVTGCAFIGIEDGRPWKGETIRERAGVFFHKVEQ